MIRDFICGGKGRHLSEKSVADLRQSGLSDGQIRACGFWTETDPAAVARLLNWKAPAKALVPCLVIPYRNPDGTFNGYHRLKPANPNTVQLAQLKKEPPAMMGLSQVSIW